MPIKFEIYRAGQILTTFTPVTAVAVGPESVPIPGDVVFQDGLLQVLRTDEIAAGVSLLWEAGVGGTYVMETTRLQPREKAYNLNIELARFRLMKIVQKQEDWNLFDFPRAEKVTLKFREAQVLFAEALGKLDEPAEAARMADQVLELAIEISEEIAAFHSELLLNRRRQSNQLAKHIFGCRVDSTVQNQKYKDTLAGQFDYAVLPMSWKQLQPEEGVFNTQPVDDWVDMLTRKRVPIVAGPLIDLSEASVPDWMFIWEHDFDTLRELAYEHVQKVVHRYRKVVAVWNVAAGLHTATAFSLSFEQVIELTRLLVSQVKTVLPGARTIVTVQQPWGEYHARSNNSVPPMLYAEMVAQSGINFDALGLEMELGVPSSGKYVRDLFQISCMLDKFSTVGRPVFITALGVPDRMVGDPSDQSEGRMVPSAAGRWRRPWDPMLQAKWADSVYRLALSKPFVESIAWGNLADINPTIPGGGLLDDMLRPKPAFLEVQKLREAYQRVSKPLMSPPLWPGLPQMWTRQQRGVLIGLLLVLSVLFAIVLIRNSQNVPQDLPNAGPRAREVMTLLDLNTADAASLSAIPRLGIAKAKAIVAFRQQFTAAHPGKRAFERIEDLYQIKGIGVATMELLRQYTFIAALAASKPSPALK